MQHMQRSQQEMGRRREGKVTPSPLNRRVHEHLACISKPSFYLPNVDYALDTRKVANIVQRAKIFWFSSTSVLQTTK